MHRHSRTQQYEWENWTLTSLRKAVALTWLISLVSWDRIVTPMMQCSTLSWGRRGQGKELVVGCFLWASQLFNGFSVWKISRHVSLLEMLYPCSIVTGKKPRSNTKQNLNVLLKYFISLTMQRFLKNLVTRANKTRLLKLLNPHLFRVGI